jgi:hypothetical protein
MACLQPHAPVAATCTCGIAASLLFPGTLVSAAVINSHVLLLVAPQVGPHFAPLKSGDGPLDFKEVQQRLDEGMGWLAGLYANTMNVSVHRIVRAELRHRLCLSFGVQHARSGSVVVQAMHLYSSLMSGHMPAGRPVCHHGESE